MKRFTTRLAFVAAAVMTLFVSCSKDNIEPEPKPEPGKELKVTLETTDITVHVKNGKTSIGFSYEGEAVNVTVKLYQKRDEEYEPYDMTSETKPFTFECVNTPLTAAGEIRFIGLAELPKSEFGIKFTAGELMAFVPVTITVKKALEGVKFADGTTEKSILIAEYERFFHVPLNGDYAGAACRSEDDANWFESIQHNGTACIWIKANTGTERTTRIKIHVKNATDTLYLTVTQKGEKDKNSMRGGLAALYQKTNGAGWRDSEGWCKEKDFRNWKHVSTSKENFQKNIFFDTSAGKEMYYGMEDKWQLFLYGEGLKGTIPEEFWDACRFFSSILVIENSPRTGQAYTLFGTVPDRIWNENLEEIEISYPGIEWTLNSSVSNAKNLRTLNIWYAKSGNLADLTSLKNLKSLDLINGNITGDISTIMSLDLEIIRLSGMGITGTFPANFASKNIKEFDIDQTGVTGTVPEDVFTMENLETFSISYNNIGGTLPKEIGKMKSLRNLQLEYCEFKGRIPEELGTLENLEYVYLDANYFENMPEFYRYTNFKTLGESGWANMMMIPVSQRYVTDGRPETSKEIAKLCHYNWPKWIDIHFDGADKQGFKTPKTAYPIASDIQYPANEYYLENGEWRHEKLEYPAKEYYFNGTEWVHDATCPWSQLVTETKSSHRAFSERDYFVSDEAYQRYIENSRNQIF